MKITMLAVVGLCALWGFVSGAVAIATGRVLAWRAWQVLRPQLWGAGQLCLTAALVVAVLSKDASVTTADVLFAAALLCVLAHFLLSRRARRP